MKMDRQKVLLVVISAALLVSLAYILAGEYQRNQFSAYQQGVQVGYTEAVRQLLSQVSTCQQVPVTLENQTLNVIAVECLQQAQQ